MNCRSGKLLGGSDTESSSSVSQESHYESDRDGAGRRGLWIQIIFSNFNPQFVSLCSSNRFQKSWGPNCTWLVDRVQAFLQKGMCFWASSIWREREGTWNTSEACPKETTSLKKPCGMVTRASFRNGVFEKIIINCFPFYLCDSMNFKTCVPLPSNVLCPKYTTEMFGFLKRCYSCWQWDQGWEIRAFRLEPVRIQSGKLPGFLRELSLGTSEFSWWLALCSFPDTVHPSQHSRWDNSKRTHYDQWWHPAENQVLHGRPWFPFTVLH